MKTRFFSMLAGGLALSGLLFSCGANSTDGNAYKPADNSETPMTAQQIDGQQLFVQNCAACHQKDRDAVGPALKGVRARWEGDNKRLYAYIRNNIEVTASGDPRAVQVQQKWGGAMPLFDGLSDEQIEAILEWVEL